MCLWTVLPNLPFIIFAKGSSNKIPTKTSNVRHAKERIKRLPQGFHVMIRSEKHFPPYKTRLAVKNYCFLPKLNCYSLFIIDSTNNQRASDIIYIYTAANVFFHPWHFSRVQVEPAKLGEFYGTQRLRNVTVKFSLSVSKNSDGHCFCIRSLSKPIPGCTCHACYSNLDERNHVKLGLD